MPPAVEIQLQAAPPPPGPPGAGQVFVWSKAVSEQVSLAQRVCTLGMDGFAHGTGPIERILVFVGPTGPTLDDLLAASFLRYLSDIGVLPAGAELFARFAALVREGFTPAAEPVESSLDAVFRALCAEFEDAHDSAEARAGMIREWGRFEKVIFAAMERGADPFKETLFTESAGFAKEIAFLREDQRVYARDLQSAKRLELTIDGKPLPGLVLHGPGSLLFKRWARHDSAAPGRNGYALLAVNWPHPENKQSQTWVISTDPVYRLSLATLAGKLQGAEGKVRDAANPKNRWFDGASFKHTLIASPDSGTVLSERQILDVLLEWGQGREIVDETEAGGRTAKGTGHRFDPGLMRAGIAAVILVGLLVTAWIYSRREPPLPPQTTDLDYCNTLSVQTRDIDVSNNAAVFVGVNDYGSDFRPLTFAVDDAVALAHLFVIELKLIAPENAWLALAGAPATRFTERQLDELKKAGVHGTDGSYTSLRADFAVASRIAKSPDNLLLVSISTHGFDDGKSAYIIPADGKRPDILGTCLSVPSINDLLNQSQARKRILFVDACRDAPQEGTRAGSAPYTETFFDAFKKAHGEAWFASCGPGQLSNEHPTAGHGIFTYFLLHALKGKAPADTRGFITLGTVEKYVSAQVADWSRRFNTQTPFYQPNEGASDIPFAVPGAGVAGG